MKKVIVFVSIVAILLISQASYADTPLKKLGRGVANFFTCPYEIIYRIGKANEEDGPIAAASWGVLDGFYRAAVRGVVGIYEVVTFPIPIPGDYRPIITDPEFFLEEGLF